jgi:hypothetical protein
MTYDGHEPSYTHLDSCQTPISAYVRRYRYIVILTPIPALISMKPDIGVHPISGIPTSGIPNIGYTPISGYPISTIYRYRISRYRDTRYRVYTDIGISDIGHDFSRFCLPGARRGWLSGCWRLFEIAREGMLKCNDLDSLPI